MGVGDSVFFEVVYDDNSRQENRGIITSIDDDIVTIKAPGLLEMQIIRVTMADIKIKNGIYRLRRYVPESECMSAD